MRNAPRSLSPVTTQREVLPDDLKPIHYELCFKPHLERATELHGIVDIELAVF
jgi:hypothetical protein